MAEIGVLQGKTKVQLQSYKKVNCIQRGDGTSTSYLFSAHISLGLTENVTCTRAEVNVMHRETEARTCASGHVTMVCQSQEED